MREIKFRAWDVWEQTWLNEERCWQELENISRWNPEVGEIFKISQYTGLKDKNGKEIYEGDIILTNPDNFERRAEVRWGLGTGYGLWIHYGLHPGWAVWNLSHWDEVIGNIYENPELTKAVADGK